MMSFIPLLALICAAMGMPSDNYVIRTMPYSLVHSVAKREAACPKNKGGSKLSSAEATAYLNMHNNLRSNEGVPDLVWDKSLAAQAQMLADRQTTCKMQHLLTTCDGVQLGQNLARDWSDKTLNGNMEASKSVQAWYDEKKDYNYRSNTCAKGKVCGHYTQVVWKTTKRVGCAARNCGKERLVVCDYFPPGNWIGEKPY